MRYFKTPYAAGNETKLLLHNNELDNTPNAQWLVKAINDLNEEGSVSTIRIPEEITEQEYNTLMAELPDA